MVNTRGQLKRIEGTGARSTASGSREPRVNAAPQFSRAPPMNAENVPTLREMFEQLQHVQGQLARTQNELTAVRAECVELRSRVEGTEDEQTNRIPIKRQSVVGYSTHSLTATNERPNKKLKCGPSKGNDDKKVVSWCDRCKTRHFGHCSSTTLRCHKCGNTGHLMRDCTDVLRCFKCKESGHCIADCPKWKADDKRNNKSKLKARASRLQSRRPE